MDGDWHIGGDMRVNRVLSDEEVAAINKEHGLFDLERREPSNELENILSKYGAVGGAGTAGLLAAGQSEEADAGIFGPVGSAGYRAARKVLADRADGIYSGDPIRAAREANAKEKSDINKMAVGTAAAMGAAAALKSDDADAGVTLRFAQGVDLDRLVGAWRKAVSREPDIHPSTHLEKIIHNKDFINYDDWAKYARNKDGGKNGETYFNELKPFLIDISKHPNVAKDNRLRLGLTDYANKRFAIRKAEGHRPDGPRGGQRGSADPYSLLPVAGIGAAAASLTAPFIKDSGMASAPRSETLGDITMGLRDVERRLEGSPASLLFPEGLTNYLETVNRSTEDPNWLTRTMAALDFAP